MRKIAVVAAGGTGGHLFPAQALAEALIARGWRIVLATDERGAASPTGFPAEERIGPVGRHLQAAATRSAWSRPASRSLRGVHAGRAPPSARMDPAVVVGLRRLSVRAGPAGRASPRGGPTLIHEQNAVMGRANRFLAGHVDAVACAFPTLQKAPAAVAENARASSGNPVRPGRSARWPSIPTPRPTADGPMRLLVTGGSQGARLLSELMPEAIKTLPEDLRHAARASSSRPAPRVDGQRPADLSPTPWSTPRSPRSSATWPAACATPTW